MADNSGLNIGAFARRYLAASGDQERYQVMMAVRGRGGKRAILALAERLGVDGKLMWQAAESYRKVRDAKRRRRKRIPALVPPPLPNSGNREVGG
ncbi:hypothetical protein [Ammonifex thiophilus]|uniref:Uncharacterized protein n=1 Tax=Ammonifex thiophilus TaxID=444093 RepID=A0A3D8P476_9THEO|nr:hypothetical protein [Ammonifex thiophilus]RDV83903.1 hypothetical protein DXX99_03450 [Ammonifex thiophilus]